MGNRVDRRGNDWEAAAPSIASLSSSHRCEEFAPSPSTSVLLPPMEAVNGCASLGVIILR